MMLSAVRPCTCMTWELSLVELSPHIPETGGPCTLPLYPISIGRLHLHLHQIPDQSSYTKLGKSHEVGLKVSKNTSLLGSAAGSRLWQQRLQ
jgi:hypothetical protein